MASLRSPVVEMLWEPHDPHEVLVERFGLTDALSAANWVAATVHEHWDMRLESCERIVMSDRNALAWITTPRGRMLAKWSIASERFTRLSQIARLTRWLDRKGLPVSTPVLSLNGQPQVEVHQVSMSLQHVIRGDLLNVDDGQQVRAAGVTLAHLHQALEDYPDVDRVVPREERPQTVTARVLHWVDSAGEHVPAAARDTLIGLVANAPTDGLPTQLVHGDYRSSNVLCAGPDVAAVIDFEEARVDHRIDEIARSAVMLGTRFRDWGPVSESVRSTFLSGYQTVRPLTPVEATWLDVLVLWYALALLPSGDDPNGWGHSAICLAAKLTGPE